MRPPPGKREGPSSSRLRLYAGGALPTSHLHHAVAWSMAAASLSGTTEQLFLLI